MNEPFEPAEPCDGCTGSPWCGCWDCDVVRRHAGRHAARQALPQRRPAAARPVVEEVA